MTQEETQEEGTDQADAEILDTDLDAPVPNSHFVQTGDDKELKQLKASEQAIDLARGNLNTKNFKGVSYQAYPLGKKKILVRFENILDRFDVSNSETKYIDLINFAKDFWYDSQPSAAKQPQGAIKLAQKQSTGAPIMKTLEKVSISDLVDPVAQPQPIVKPLAGPVVAKIPVPAAPKIPFPTIQEMTIAGVQKLTERNEKSKGPDGKPLTWIGEDDKNVTKTAVWKPIRDKNGFKGIALEPMRIRTFVIDFDTQATKKLQEEKIKEKQAEVKKKAIEEKIVK